MGNSREPSLARYEGIMQGCYIAAIFTQKKEGV